jgi:hypothetical protein
MTVSKNVFHEESYKYIPTSEEFRKFGESTHGKGRHKAHKVGDRISFRTPKGRQSGKVIEVHKEHYMIESRGVEQKINRNSILYSLGTFAGKVAESYNSAKSAYEFGKEKEQENLKKYKESYGKKRRAGPKRKPKKK